MQVCKRLARHMMWVTVFLAVSLGTQAKALSAQGAVVIDADTGAVRFAHHAQKVLPMASTTKIMTALCAVEQGDLGLYSKAGIYTRRRVFHVFKTWGTADNTGHALWTHAYERE